MPRQTPVDEVFSKLVDKYKKELGFFLLSLILVGGLILSYLFSRRQKKEGIQIVNEKEVLSVGSGGKSSTTPTPEEKIIVDVSGAVNEPGVYRINKGSRVESVVDAAGGFSGEADNSWIAKNINLARKLSDGEKVYIPTQREVADSKDNSAQQVKTSVKGTTRAVGSSSSSKTRTPVSGKININTASQSELESLHGIGPVYARRIIEGRPYQKVGDLIQVKGIGPKTLEEIRGKVIAGH